jgi:transposase
LASIAISYYFYRRGKKERRPVYVVTGNPVVRTYRDREIVVLFGGSEVPVVTRTIVTFWNAGQESIRAADVVEDHRVHIEFPAGTNILDALVVEATRPEIDFACKTDSHGSRVLLSFSHLNFRDGPSCQHELRHSTPSITDEGEREHSQLMTVTMTAPRTRVDPGGMPSPPDPEVPEKAKRRRFSAEYKLAILREADACTEPGQIGALLRRERLYSSHLVDWRRQRETGVLEALARKRGPKPADPARVEADRLRRENERLRGRLAQAERIIEIQGKVSELLGIPLDPASDDEQSAT